MSFNVSKAGTKAEVQQTIDQTHLPETIRSYLNQGMSAFKDEDKIAFVAYGHLYEGGNSHETTTAYISMVRMPA